MEPEPADPSPRPVLPRSAIILLTLACATVVAFGIAAMRGDCHPGVLCFCADALRSSAAALDASARSAPGIWPLGIHHRGRLRPAGRLRRSAGCLAGPVLRIVAAVRSPNSPSWAPPSRSGWSQWASAPNRRRQSSARVHSRGASSDSSRGVLGNITEHRGRPRGRF